MRNSVIPGVLDKLLELQKLDQYDIEGIYPIFCSLKDSQAYSLESQVESEPSRLSSVKDSGSVQKAPEWIDKSRDKARNKADCDESEYITQHHALMQLPLHSKLDLIKDWLIAATAKDCSIFVTFQVVRAPEHQHLKASGDSFPKLLLYSSTEFDFLYKVQIGDLDLKPLSKIAYQHQLDKSILRAVAQDANASVV